MLKLRKYNIYNKFDIFFNYEYKKYNKIQGSWNE